MFLLLLRGRYFLRMARPMPAARIVIPMTRRGATRPLPLMSAVFASVVAFCVCAVRVRRLVGRGRAAGSFSRRFGGIGIRTWRIAWIVGVGSWLIARVIRFARAIGVRSRCITRGCPDSRNLPGCQGSQDPSMFRGCPDSRGRLTCRGYRGPLCRLDCPDLLCRLHRRRAQDRDLVRARVRAWARGVSNTMAPLLPRRALSASSPSFIAPLSVRT